jgi:hypothetical protein
VPRRLARRIIADELRQQRIPALRAPTRRASRSPSTENFSQQPADGRGEACACGSNARRRDRLPIAPPQVFSLPAGKKVKIRTADGVFQVKALDQTMPLGAFPVGVARNSVVAALRETSRRQLFERWFNRPLNDQLKNLRCADDQLPAVAVVDMTTFLPFLTL